MDTHEIDLQNPQTRKALAVLEVAYEKGRRDAMRELRELIEQYPNPGTALRA